MSVSLFDLVNNIYSKRMFEVSSQDISKNLWMINRFLSMDLDLLPYIAEFSRYMFRLQDRYYWLLYRLVPSSPVQKNKYSKPKKEFNDNLLERYALLYRISEREAVNVLKILGKSYNKKEIFENVGLEEKDATK